MRRKATVWAVDETVTLDHGVLMKEGFPVSCVLCSMQQVQLLFSKHMHTCALSSGHSKSAYSVSVVGLHFGVRMSFATPMCLNREHFVTIHVHQVWGIQWEFTGHSGGIRSKKREFRDFVTKNTHVFMMVREPKLTPSSLYIKLNGERGEGACVLSAQPLDLEFYRRCLLFLAVHRCI